MEEVNRNTAEINLGDLKELARRAFYWTSFTPDERAGRCLAEHQEQLNSDLKSIPESEREKYILSYKKYFSDWLSAHSRCASSAITGGSGFNVQRAEKARRVEHNKYGEFIEWRERALKAISKRIEESKPQEVRDAENWNRLRDSILSSAETIHSINTATGRGYSKALFVSSIYQKVETFARAGNVEVVERAIEEIREFNKKYSVVITERHKFFKLPEVARNVVKVKEDHSQKESSEIQIPGGKAIQNWKENRLQVFFDSKPNYDTIQVLKKNGFKWAPSVGAWQRFNNNNSLFALKQVILYLKSSNN